MQTEDRLIPIKEVCKMVSISQATIYRMRQRKTFPEPILTSGQIVRWRLSDIHYYIQHGRASPEAHTER
ncbi:AlpA family phage regulatory protein [uncultured Microbulbifer sp.]|uniref:helix-turn-helix transcriptional regulator n=1 Tax=uncultured Microbulbifer sp. TaxID=348147 RepID=UPI00344FB0C1